MVALEVVFSAMWALDFRRAGPALYALLGASRVAQAVSLETVSMQIARARPARGGLLPRAAGPAASYLVMATVYAAGLLASSGLVERLGGRAAARRRRSWRVSARGCRWPGRAAPCAACCW